MNEAEWLASTDPTPMLEHIRRPASDRRLRLFAVGCCRRIWHRLPDPRSRRAIEVTESFVEDRASLDELEAARQEAEAAQTERSRHRDAGENAVVATVMVPEWNPDRWPCVGSVVFFAATAAAYLAELDGKNRQERKRHYLRGYEDERAGQCELLRDIFGNPFRPVAVDPSWLTSTVVALAQQMYESRDFSPMPVLADALQDAGCDHPDVLAHCRGAGPHVRGCWVADLLLGKS